MNFGSLPPGIRHKIPAQKTRRIRDSRRMADPKPSSLDSTHGLYSVLRAAGKLKQIDNRSRPRNGVIELIGNAGQSLGDWQFRVEPVDQSPLVDPLGVAPANPLVSAVRRGLAAAPELNWDLLGWASNGLVTILFRQRGRMAGGFWILVLTPTA